MVPVTVYSEMTPNPSTMKFVANKYLLPTGASVEFENKAAAKGYSPLAEALFDFPFVNKVFIAVNFVTVAKTDNVPWDFITMELREFIREWISFGKEVLIAMPNQVVIDTQENETVAQSTTQSPVPPSFEPSPLDDAIIDLLDQYVRPAVANDGGAIDFLGFEEGKVTVMLKGSCAGCPSSTATLKGGIENLLKQHLPEVKEVVAFNT
ncbi:MAG: NifU family protein [Flavobacteriia bacterium]|jgi:Fe-S cluster biogenesis protein NfuA|nr:NifU family protein [Cryomorphaceae bacterium]